MSGRSKIVSLLALLLAGIIGWWRYNEWRDHSQDQPILRAARRYGADPALIKALVWRESRFDPTRRGRAGEIGLMQLRSVAAQEWAAAEHLHGFANDHLFDAETNALAGTWYFQKLLRRYGQTDNPLPYALADYNAGRSRVLRWNQGSALTNSGDFLQTIGFPGTRAYVQSILRRYEHYRPLFPPEGQR